MNPLEFINLGEAAHISGARFSEHNRFDPDMSDEERSDVSNGIWLCLQCHKQVDADSLYYTISYLTKKKEKHERKVSAGFFDIKLKEYQDLTSRVAELQQLVKAGEEVARLQGENQRKELEKLQAELSFAISEKLKIEDQFEALRKVVSGFQNIDPNGSIPEVLDFIASGNLSEAKAALSSETLVNDENLAARKRLLRANINEIEKNFAEAEADYLKSSVLSDGDEFFESYIYFLTRMRKYDLAIAASLGRIKSEKKIESLIWLHNMMGEIYSAQNENLKAAEYFGKAKKILESVPDKINVQLYQLGKISQCLGRCYRNLGKLDEALVSYQEALNLYFQSATEEGFEDNYNLGNLLADIGLLHFQNEQPDKALHYYEKAETAYQNSGELGFLGSLILGMNAVDVYCHNKLKNFKKARMIINDVLEPLKFCFEKSPLAYLKYYVSAITKSGNIFMFEQKKQEAEDEYLLALSIAEDFNNRYGISCDDELTTLYYNYSNLLFENNIVDQGFVFSDKAIKLLSLMPDSEHDKNFSLAKIYYSRSRFLKTKEQRLTEITKARFLISKCNIDKTVAKAYQMAIDSLYQDIEKL